MIFKEPIKLQEYLFDIAISIGISLFPNNGLDTEDLIKEADTAMYSVKMLVIETKVNRENLNRFSPVL